MIGSRPNPDQLLVKLKEEELRAHRGKLKIFFGASAGVGKTYAMLLAARQQITQGIDIVIGVVETHGRKETESLLEGLERLPLKEISYRDKLLKEFDIDGALTRHPTLILIDELAHSNAPGSRHPKRWQDVEELLIAGINVYSTINVQHLETLNDVIGGITGIRVWETVPDQIFDTADEVMIVDLPPDELLQRLKEGKVYLPLQAERAIQNFFRKGNLIALRELALRRTADRVDHQMLKYRHDQSVTPVWQTRESLLACIGQTGGDRVIRSAARIATNWNIPWHVIYVETPKLQYLAEPQRQPILKNLKLAQEMGAETATLAGDDIIETVIHYARDHNLSRVMVGRDQNNSWWPWYRSFADRISVRATDLDIIQVARDDGSVKKTDADRAEEQTWGERLQAPWQAYAMSVAICGLTIAITTPLYALFDLTNIVMFFLLSVVLVAVRHGLGPSIIASLLNVAAFDFFYVEPRFSFSVGDMQYLITFIVMIAVGLVIARLTTGLKYQARVATRREQRVRALYEMSRDLSGALMTEQINGISQRFAAAEFSAQSILLLTDDNDRLIEPNAATNNCLIFDMGIGQWAFDRCCEAGRGTDTLPGSPALYIPLKAPMRTRGVLVLEPRNPRRLMAPEQRRMLDTFARLIAISLERIHYVNIAQETTLHMESERLRNSLLAAISHDLRTPLAVLVGLADSISLLSQPLTGPALEIVASMREEALRMNSLVNNLLDMAHLQSGTVKLKREWQTLEEVVGSALKTMQASNHHININLPDNLPLLEFDAILIERVLANLLENAVKYTPFGSTIGIGAALGNRDYVDIWVEDNGPGLPLGKEEDIFKKFERGQKESTTAGVGLGLAICRAILEAHNGMIHAENRRNGGMRFTFSLPRGNPPVISLTEEKN